MSYTFAYINALKLVLDYELILEKVRRVIEFNQEACVRKDYGECKESQGYQLCSKRQNKKQLGDKIPFGKGISMKYVCK